MISPLALISLILVAIVLFPLIANEGFRHDVAKIIHYKSSVEKNDEFKAIENPKTDDESQNNEREGKRIDTIAAAALALQAHAQKLIFITLSFFLITKGIVEILDTFNLFDTKIIEHEIYYWQGTDFHFVKTYWKETQEKWPIIAHIKHVKTLSYVANALAISCGLQLAYMLVTEGPDEAIEPIMLGIASVILLILSTVEPSKWNTYNSISILLLIAGIFFLFLISGKLKHQDNEKE